MIDSDFTQVELFSGGGGMALGLARAGFRTLGHVEKDEAASQTFQFNFTRLHGREIRRAGDITKVKSPRDFLRELEHGQLDLLAGGPPCQAYSKAGRGKLASIKGGKGAHLEDPRGQLYKNYLQFVEELKPRAVLMENVPDIMNYGGDNIAEFICEDLVELGYRSAYTVLNAASYGVPQARERWFLIAFTEESGIEPKFPSPTHIAKDTGDSAFSPLAALKKNIELSPRFARWPETAAPGLPAAVTVGEALSDLPTTSAWYQGIEKKHHFCTHVNDALPYRDHATTAYQQDMRTWPGFVSFPSVTGNVFRVTQRDFPIFARLKPDDRYEQACLLAEQNLFEKAQRIGLSGKSLELLRNRLADWRKDLSVEARNRISRTREGQLLAKFVPPYDPTQFLDKWRVLNPETPSHTVVAHLSVDTYSHIHYDSAQARAVTVREAARLQSFPDGFLFPGNMGSAYKQIGNAVPPLLAHQLGLSIRNSLTNAMDHRTR